MIKKIEKGYYCTERKEFIDQFTMSDIEKGFSKIYLVFLNENEFKMTSWRNKEKLYFSELNSISRGGKYCIDSQIIKLNYSNTEYKETFTIINENRLIYNISELGIPFNFIGWEEEPSDSELMKALPSIFIKTGK